MPEKAKKGCLIVTGVPVLVSHLMWVPGTKLEYLQDQQVVLTAEMSLKQPSGTRKDHLWGPVRWLSGQKILLPSLTT